MRTCVLDISKKRVGIAISDDECKFIIKSKCINYLYFSQLKKALIEIYTKYNISRTLVGMPYSSDTDIQVRYIKHTCHNLREIINPYQFINENFSTIDAITYKDEYPGLTIDEIVCRRLFEMYKAI